MRRRNEHLGVDKAADRVDHADDSEANTVGVADVATISDLTATTERTAPWILSHMVFFRMQERRLSTAQNYCDFMRRARWKVEQQAARRELGITWWTYKRDGQDRWGDWSSGEKGIERDGVRTPKNGEVFECYTRLQYGDDRMCPWQLPEG
jgi:hypothetical protein